MNKEIAVHYSVSDIERMAIGIAESGLFGAKTPEHAFALMLVAQAEGRHPATIAQEYDIIQGRPALKSQSALARFQAAGGRIQWVERSDLACEARFVHEQGGELTIRWTMERAKAAQLTSKDNWKRFPAQMLSARVVAEGVRAVFPACLNGVYLAEEVADFEAPLDRKKEVKPEAKAVYISREKAHTLARRANEAGLTQEQIFGAVGSDPDKVTPAAAKAFFAVVEDAEQRAVGRDEIGEGGMDEAIESEEGANA